MSVSIINFLHTGRPILVSKERAIETCICDARMSFVNSYNRLRYINEMSTWGLRDHDSSHELREPVGTSVWSLLKLVNTGACPHQLVFTAHVYG